jgi:2'-hydroxyisoflavone reductase
MQTNRRVFLSSTAAAGALLALNKRAAAQDSKSADKPKALNMLVLGGTGLIGPALVEYAQSRGHTVALFNRGKTNPQLFPELEKLRGDRNPDKDEGLKALEGRKFDVVFDDTGYYPRHVKASAELMAPNIGHYIYVSSISCYARNDIEGMDEDAECGTMPDPTLEEMGKNYEYYGPLKALCEQAAEAAMPGKTCVIRPGYIVGPGDGSHRFGYWPMRADKGGDFVVPGAPTDPVQVIDVRDLSEWMVHVAEQKLVGRFNACGPEKKLEWGKVIDACVKHASNECKPHWASLDVLQKFPAAQFPIWAPYAGETKGFHTVSNARAVKNGMRFRPIDTIVKDTLDWYRGLPEERRAQLFKRNLSADLELEILAALKKA